MPLPPPHRRHRHGHRRQRRVVVPARRAPRAAAAPTRSTSPTPPTHCVRRLHSHAVANVRPRSSRVKRRPVGRCHCQSRRASQAWPANASNHQHHEHEHDPDDQRRRCHCRRHCRHQTPTAARRTHHARDVRACRAPLVPARPPCEARATGAAGLQTKRAATTRKRRRQRGRCAAASWHFRIPARR